MQLNSVQYNVWQKYYNKFFFELNSYFVGLILSRSNAYPIASSLGLGYVDRQRPHFTSLPSTHRPPLVAYSLSGVA